VIAAVLLAAALQAPQSPYADSATAALVARARQRHYALDAAVHDYRATVTTKLDAAFARGRFARLLPIGVLEQVATLSWQAPNDVQLVTLGQRNRTAFRGADMDARWDRPWFIPRFLGDSIHLIGNDFPNRPAVHPLATGAERFYRYAIEDSLELALPGRTVKAIAVRVTPTRAEGSLVAGQLWLDAQSAEVVRFRFTFVGRDLWAGHDSLKTRRDSTDARRSNDLANRVLRVSADLEYGLFSRRFWLPYRQSIVLDIELPWFGGVVIPVTFVSTFTDLSVNGGAPIVFTVALPDTGAVVKVERGKRGVTLSGGNEGAQERRRRLAERERQRAQADSTRRREGYTSAGRWPGGRFEIRVPPDSVLDHYDGWHDSLTLALSSDDVARIDDLRRQALALRGQLPAELIGSATPLFSIDRFADLLRYNRAEGLAAGAGISWPLGGPYVTLAVRGRYAFTDQRLQAAVALRRDVIGGRTEMSLFREMTDADPLAHGLGPGNSFRALFLALDDGSYLFAQGVEVRREFSYRNAADVSLGIRFAQERAPNHLAHAALHQLLGGRGDFAPLDPVRPGTFTTVTAGISGGLVPTSWKVGAEVTTGAGATAGRLWAAASGELRGPGSLQIALNGWAGAGAGDSVPQREFRLGGTQTLRGYEAGTFRGPSAYAGSVDVSLRRRGLSPVVFADVGQASERGVTFHGDPRVSVGAGVVALGGLVRVHAARPVASRAPWRFDLVFGPLR
jgi:hypothetical protein